MTCSISTSILKRPVIHNNADAARVESRERIALNTRECSRSTPSLCHIQSICTCTGEMYVVQGFRKGGVVRRYVGRIRQRTSSDLSCFSTWARRVTFLSSTTLITREHYHGQPRQLHCVQADSDHSEPALPCATCTTQHCPAILHMSWSCYSGRTQVLTLIRRRQTTDQPGRSIGQFLLGHDVPNTTTMDMYMYMYMVQVQ